MNGKGDSPRPLSVDMSTYVDNWERIFGKKNNQSLYHQYTEELHSGLFFERYPDLSGDWNLDKDVWMELKKR